MGLDIRAFNKLEKCQLQSSEAYERYNNCVELTPKDFIFDQSSGLEGYYLYNGEYLTFRAGAYSSYVKWRKMLSEMIGYPDIEKLWDSVNRDITIGEILEEKSAINSPFIELICFSDCEGFIGPKVSKKLYKDFVDYRQKAFEYSASKKNSDWLSLYDDFLKAFKIASNNGCVEFC